MTHISEPLKWTDGVFSGFCDKKSELILFLSDGTKRVMNFKNWENSYPQTLENLKILKSGDLIKYATWNGYDEKQWFCDVKLR